MDYCNLSYFKDQKWALFIAHPGHELRIHHTLELTQPLTFVLTDGSGLNEASRLNSTDYILKQVGVNPGAIYGYWSDTQIYDIILQNDVCVLKKLCETLADNFIQHNINCVLGDALEGYNPSHDLCRLLLNTAVALIEQTGRIIKNFDFPLYGDPAACPTQVLDQSIHLQLDEIALQKKISAAKNYPELISEFNAAMSHIGEKAFSVECLRSVENKSFEELAKEKPMYEIYGAIKVALGQYKEAIQFNKHMRPLMEQLWKEFGLVSEQAIT